MKIFSNQTDFGNKANNLITLHKNNFLLPETFILGNEVFTNISLAFLCEKKSYILRPSFSGEDSDKKSLAGKFKSIFPLKKDEIHKIFQQKNFSSLFEGEGYELKSIIIQEYIENAIFGVFFTRNPENILYNGSVEVGSSNTAVTSGSQTHESQLSFFQSQELGFLGEKIEHLFGTPQDIEFCFQKNTCILLQTRPITTGNHPRYNFPEIQKLNGFYTTLDFDELGEVQNAWQEHLLKPLFHVLLLGEKLFFKKTFFPYFLWRNIDNSLEKSHADFLKSYQKYLQKKYIFGLIKYFCFQKFEGKILDDFFKNYFYRFEKNTPSFLHLNFNVQTNWITRKFLAVEKQKYESFVFLEAYKKTSSFFDAFPKEKQNYENILFFHRGKIRKKIVHEVSNTIYKGKIQGTLVDINHFNPHKKNQVLISENLDFSLYDKLDGLSGVLIKNGNLLSHNSIVLREFKIPSKIRYKNFENLIIGNEINIE